MPRIRASRWPSFPRITRVFACFSLIASTLSIATAVPGQEVPPRVVAPAGPRATEFARHVVVAHDEFSASAGEEMLSAGGNAIDAAIATAFAMAVTHPAAGNIGGGGFIVAFLADRKEVKTFDFREVAPGTATETMYLDADGKLLPRHRAGPRAAGVPGTPRGLELAHGELGSLPWRRLLEPSIRLARDGFPISDVLAESLNAQLQPIPRDPNLPDENPGARAERLADFPSSRAAFGKADGSPWRGGDLLKQPDLAATLERIAENGAAGFYEGKTAELIVAAMTADGGEMTLDDLKNYQAKERPPVTFSFRGYEIHGMGPPSSGGVVVGQTLGMLERFDLKDLGRESPRAIHLVAEAMRRAFFTRATRLGDPDFVEVPVARLLDKTEIDRLAASIGDKATPSAELADFPILPIEGEHTTHFSVIDGEGNAVALTYTLEESYGSKYVVPGAGFLLNNEMGDFNITPGRTDATGRIGTEPNRIRPGKRMLSSMSPTIATRDGKVRLVTGSPGGRTIPNTTLWVLLNVLEFEMEPQAAVNAARTHHQWFPDVLRLEGNSWPPELRRALSEMGHRLSFGGIQGDAHTIAVDPGTGKRLGAPDPRRRTAAAAGR